ncbi:MAG: nucleotidyltransferase domain-containing protein [Promethearchaeota archaeon]
MAERREYDQRYASIWRSIGNFLKNNSGFPVSGVARGGSRRRGDYNADSDLDIIFAIAGNPRKDQVYPQLVERLKRGMNVQARIGSSYNVIKIIKDNLKIDLVLRTENEFQEQVRKYRLEQL